VLRAFAGLTLAVALLAPATARATPNARPNTTLNATPNADKDLSAALPAAQAWVERRDALIAYLKARQAADVATYIKAVTEANLAEYLRAMTPIIAVDWGRWEALHNCEQPGDWYANGGNSGDALHLTFQGGLGMSTHAWQMARGAAAARGVTLPNSALAATPEQQMTGAQAFYDAYGWWWACRV
jgi:hypothetical protein